MVSKTKRIWIPCPYHHCFFFLHGSFGLNSKWEYINPTYCTMVVVGVSTSIPLGPIWHNPVWVKILYPKTRMVYIYQKTQQKSKKNVSSISHCEMSFMWVPTGCGFLGGKSEPFRTEVSKYHGSWWNCVSWVTTGLGMVRYGFFGCSVCHSQETNSAAAAILEPEMSDPGAKSVSKRAAWCRSRGHRAPIEDPPHVKI